MFVWLWAGNVDRWPKRLGTRTLRDHTVERKANMSGGCDEKRTDSDGWVEFRNHGERPGTIWVHGERMGDHSLADGKTYSYTL